MPEQLFYFRLSEEELLMEAEMEYPLVDPRIWNEAIRRGIQGRLNSTLMRTQLKRPLNSMFPPKTTVRLP